MWSLFAFVTGWLLGRRLSRPEDSSGAFYRLPADSIANAIAEERSADGRGRQFFIAGIAFGVVGNAVIALVLELSPPGLVRFALFTLIAIGGVAYADTALRGANIYEALYEGAVFLPIFLSLVLLLGELMRLGGFGCDGCPSDLELIVASLGYWGVAVTAFVLRWLFVGTRRETAH
jgi:hypothetical protein